MGNKTRRSSDGDSDEERGCGLVRGGGVVVVVLASALVLTAQRVRPGTEPLSPARHATDPGTGGMSRSHSTALACSARSSRGVVDADLPEITISRDTHTRAFLAEASRGFCRHLR